jgi:hypothetical protein
VEPAECTVRGHAWSGHTPLAKAELLFCAGFGMGECNIKAIALARQLPVTVDCNKDRIAGDNGATIQHDDLLDCV